MTHLWEELTLKRLMKNLMMIKKYKVSLFPVDPMGGSGHVEGGLLQSMRVIGDTPMFV